MDEHATGVASSIGLVVATPVAAWGLVGDLSIKDDDLDYIVRAPHVHPALAALAGIVAVTVVILTAVSL